MSPDEKDQEAGPASKNMCGLPTPFYLEKKMGESMGRSEILQRQVQNEPSPKYNQ